MTIGGVKNIKGKKLAKAAKKAVSKAKNSGKNLVIVESPAKAKTINKYLGNTYVVKASMGHVRDLPSRNPKGVKNPVPGVDLENNFEPEYQALPRGKKTLTELRKLAKDAPMVYLATDLDREGEAIAWHLAQALKLKPETTRRVVFNEITKSAIQDAFAHPRSINQDMVDAQQARRILDRIVGYQVSPVLWKKVAGGLSAGRVQSVAVRLIVEREELIDAFNPEEYWDIQGVFSTDLAQTDGIRNLWSEFLAQRDEKNKPPTKKAQLGFLAGHQSFFAALTHVNGQKFKPVSAEQTLAVAKAIGFEVVQEIRTTDPKAKGVAQNKLKITGKISPDAPGFAVSSVSSRQTKTKPYAPFTTATLQQSASVQLRFGARRTMRIAQQLYEGINIGKEGTVGLITYMRTDSKNISADAISSVRGLIDSEFGAPYLPEKPNYYTSGGRAQEAHEAIRPTDPTRTPASIKSRLTEEQFKLYDLIWRRFVACQMNPAIWHITEAEISVTGADNTSAKFKATGKTLGFDGHLRVMGISNNSGDQILPALSENQSLGAIAIDPCQHFTQPPARYTEASLVKALEAENIGRPSTYAAIIQTIQDRKYAEIISRAFHPTDLGTVVTHKLIEGFPEVFQVRFTAHMEDELDKIEEHQVDWHDVLRDFYNPFKQQLDSAAEQMQHAKMETQPSDYKCPDCGAQMEYRFGKNGRFLSCTEYPNCKKAMPIDREGNPVGQETTNIACPVCHKPTVLRKGRFGPFLSCVDYPDCTGIVNLDKNGCVKHPTAPPLKVDLECNKCDSKEMNLRRSKRGPWISCARYPKCRGRLGWKSLDEKIKTDLETKLEKWEEANPVRPICTVDGEVCSDAFKPEIVEGSPVDTDSKDASEK